VLKEHLVPLPLIQYSVYGASALAFDQAEVAMSVAGNSRGRRGYQRELAEIIPLVDVLIEGLQRRLRADENDEIDVSTRYYLMSALFPAIKEVLDRGSVSLAVTVARQYVGGRMAMLGDPHIKLMTKDELTPLQGVQAALRGEQQQRRTSAPSRQSEGQRASGVPHQWDEGPSGPARRQYRGTAKARSSQSDAIVVVRMGRDFVI
jgi:hypothetical protein